jgi:hypothetical protein
MVSLPIEEMTIEEKLQTMEALWADLCRNEETLTVHQWQTDILDKRARLIEEGKARFIDWEQAKTEIGDETS